MRPMLHERPVLLAFGLWLPENIMMSKKSYQLLNVLPVLQNTQDNIGFKDGSQTITWQTIFEVTI